MHTNRWTVAKYIALGFAYASLGVHYLAVRHYKSVALFATGLVISTISTLAYGWCRIKECK